MSYKDKIKEQVKAIVASGKNVEAGIVAMVKKDYEQTVKDSKVAGQSLKKVTYDTLEGIEEGLKSTKYNTKEILKKSSDTMVEVVKKSANTSIDETNKLLEDAQAKLHKSVDNVKSAAKDKVDAAYEALHQKTQEEKEHLSEVAKGLKEYSKEKAHNILDSSVQKAKDAIVHTEKSFKVRSKRFLDNVEQKASSFNHALIEKIKKHL